jgi:hypothetical protein
MSLNLVRTKLLLIMVLFVSCIPAAQSSKEEISKANMMIKISEEFGISRPIIINGEVHTIKNRKGQLRRVIARKEMDNNIK